MTTPFEPTTLVEVLRHHARQYPDKLAYAFLPNGEIGTEIGVSFAELEQQARTTAAHLLRVCEPGDRVLLLYPQGIDYVVGFLGCLCSCTCLGCSSSWGHSRAPISAS